MATLEEKKTYIKTDLNLMFPNEVKASREKYIAYIKNALNTYIDKFEGGEVIDPVLANEILSELIDEFDFAESADDDVQLIRLDTIVDDRDHEPWYKDWLAEHGENQVYWPRLKNYIGKRLTKKYGPKRAGRIVGSIDDSTREIMSWLENPRRREFDTKGLVVGYVQSGKTANFTALIAKAADAGYKLLIVLAGVHDILRLQTQIRIDKELTGFRDRPDLPKEDYINPPSDRFRWNRLTTAQGQVRGGEFTVEGKEQFEYLCTDSRPIIAIMKKHSQVLKRFSEWVEKANENVRKNIPILVIDDEADQASIDTNANKDIDPSVTNIRIRELLNLFDRKAYIGYTATPFANVLIDIDSKHPTYQHDLYPRNFVASLPEPEGYFGAAKIFENELSEFFVKHIPDSDREIILPKKKKEQIIIDELPATLISAIDEYIIAIAIRKSRGDWKEATSMLVHIKHTRDHHSKVKLLVNEYLDGIRTQLKSGDGKNKYRKRLRGTYDIFANRSKEIVRRLKKTLTDPSKYAFPEFKHVWSQVPKVLSSVEVLELNYMSDDVLDYAGTEKPKVIAIGGNQLSRGLTLEGLMMSYYLRESKQYDTLLQMGRWFGYREGYEDLTRVYTSDSISSSYKFLAGVENEIRLEIGRYSEEEKITPAQLAIRIRDHANLKVTSKAKMGAAKQLQSSYGGVTKQTFYFPIAEPKVLEANHSIGESFINFLNDTFAESFSKKGDSNLWGKVPFRILETKFFDLYQHSHEFHTYGSGFDHQMVMDYIHRRLEDRELLEWNVALISRKIRKNAKNITRFAGFDIAKVDRSRYRHLVNGMANIGVLADKGDKDIDFESESDIRKMPLLRIYLVDRNSKRGKNATPKSKRVQLFSGTKNKRIDLLGFAVDLPYSKKEPFGYVGQRF